MPRPHSNRQRDCVAGVEISAAGGMGHERIAAALNIARTHLSDTLKGVGRRLRQA